MHRRLALAPLLAAALVAPPTSAAPICAGSVCTLREAAAHAGIHVGAAVNPWQQVPGTVEGDLVASEFSSVTAENQFKWSALSAGPGQYDFGAADAVLAGADAAGQRLRGHTLIWGRLNGAPAWLEGELAAAADPAARLRELMSDHISTVMGRYAGAIPTWDVVNEPLDELTGAIETDSIFYETLGIDFIAEAFHAARAADPAATLFLNETTVEGLPGKFQALLDLLDGLLADGVPIDGVGLQGHLLLAAPDGASLQSQIEQLAARGVLVEITELDIPIWWFGGEPDPLAAQAAAYAEVFAACLAVSACRGITVWGVDDSDTWLDALPPFSALAPNRPLLFDEDLAPKPAYVAVRDTLLAVPEPATAGLLAVGLASLATRRRRRTPGRASD